MPWSSGNFTTYPGRNTVLQHALFVMQFYDMYGKNAVLRHALVGTQFYDTPRLERSLTTWSELMHSFTTCTAQPCRNAVLHHALVGMQFNHMP